MLKSLLISATLISAMALTNAPINNPKDPLPQKVATKSI